jgi:hypothetical protein
MPSLLPALDKVKIVSARTRYEKFYPGQPLCWKAAAFAHEASEAFQTTVVRPRCPVEMMDDGVPSSCPSVGESDVSSEDDSSSLSGEEILLDGVIMKSGEIISFGDSMDERTAVRIVSDQLDTTPKSVMFVQSPNPWQIVGQLRLLTKHMDFVCQNGSTLDLEITSDQAMDSAKAYFEEIGCPNLAVCTATTTNAEEQTSSSHGNAAARCVDIATNQEKPNDQGDDPMHEDA